jgi:signal recognition particle GTPase
MDAAMGQQAGPQARAFNDAIGITGISTSTTLTEISDSYLPTQKQLKHMPQ